MAPPPSSSGGSPFASGRGGANNNSDALFVRLAETEGSSRVCVDFEKHFFPKTLSLSLSFLSVVVVVFLSSGDECKRNIPIKLPECGDILSSRGDDTV